MYSSPGRLWQVLVGVSLAFHLGCQASSPPKSTLGNLPRERSNAREPEISASTYFAHARLLERQGQFERAARQYHRALALRPEFLSARNRLGITLNKLGRHAEASAQFQGALASHLATAYLHNNLGFSFYLEGKYEEADGALGRALELKPDFARAHMNRALALARLNRLDEAFAELKQAGSEADAHFNMGIILIDAEEYDKAERYLEAALAIRPDFDAARRQLRATARLAAEARARQAALALAAETSVVDANSQAEEQIPTNAALEEETPATIMIETPGEDGAPESAGAPAGEALVGDEPAVLRFAQEPGIDVEFLFALIDEAIAELRNQDSDSFDSLWCRVGYYLFPETAPEEPEPEPERWLADQRDIREVAAERPVGK